MSEIFSKNFRIHLSLVVVVTVRLYKGSPG